MSDTTASLKHQMGSATDLQSVVRTMRALAASRIHQYERSVLALADYLQAVNLGLAACLRLTAAEMGAPSQHRARTEPVGVIVCGSDQGLVGRFNEMVVEFAMTTLCDMPGRKVIWAVGERVSARLQDAGVEIAEVFPVPTTVEAIASLVERLQLTTETHPSQTRSPCIHVFHNRPKLGAPYEPVGQRLLPLDRAWREQRQAAQWPTPRTPDVMGHRAATLRALAREHLFISLYRACAESLASENASRLAAMERADKNIDELLTALRGQFHSQRQRAIDEELFDVIAGCEALGQDRAA